MSGTLAVAYLAAGVLFIRSLGGLSKQATARLGATYGILGMALAIGVTALRWSEGDLAARTTGALMLGGAVAVGCLIGAVLAARVEMTGMPELIAIMHSLVGLAAAFVGWNGYLDVDAELTGSLLGIHHAEVFIGVFIGAVTFTGSVVAYLKLSARIDSRPLTLPGKHVLNISALVAFVVLTVAFVARPGMGLLIAVTVIALALGAHLVASIGGGDMPVVVSMLNSYSGWAAAGIGFTLGNTALIITGALVGSSGAILSYIMCKAMNRSFISVILGGFGGDSAAASGEEETRPVKQGSADDAAFLMSNAESVIIVPGYGLAVARTQHAVKELAQKLSEKGVNVRYAIHPVAGRMPGHMNVLLAEAEVPYDQVFEMEDINSEFGTTDVALVLGANDVVNPLAYEKGSPIYGMPILDVVKARTVLVNKRSMASGYAGLDNPLFYMDKTMMVFGDAKKTVEDIVKALD